MAKGGPSWRLNAFLDSLIMELDRAQDTLALKGMNRRLTYTVRDLNLELQLFPDFDGRELRFATAGPGESGAARIAFQLGSITDRQIRETTTEPPSRDDIAIEVMDDIDDQTKQDLRRIGVTTVKDIERMEKRNVDLKRAGGSVDYTKLANIINRTRRRQSAPVVAKAMLVGDESSPHLTLEGSNLATASSTGEFPLAQLNGSPVTFVSATASELRMVVDPDVLKPGLNTLRIALDPYAVITLDVHA
ncbi:MAG: hypothetical protein IT361_11405 [Gemmatimonadaceae bacterium]|nr:hypothetical protein [Gemmatimonadaceae bacterium]